METKQITITTDIKTDGRYCSIEGKTWSGIKSKGPLSCDFNGARRYGQGNNMGDVAKWWDYNYCSLFKLDLQLDPSGYPIRCVQCLKLG